MPAGFHDVLFPVDIGLNAKGGPVVDGVVVYRLFSGVEQRNIANEIQAVEWSISRPSLDVSQVADAIQFMRARNGKAYSFRFYDYSDYQANQSEIATASAGQTDFQLKKIYADAAGSFSRIITKPIDPNTYPGFTTPIVYVNDVEEPASNYSIDFATGVLSFDSGHALTDGDVVKVTFDFHCHVRFDMDKMMLNLPYIDFFKWNEIVLVEEKEENNV